MTRVYVEAINVIRYMHDKYAYQRLEMALHDYPVRRTMATGIAGLAVVADNLSAIRDARVKVVRDDTGLVVDYEVEGDYPAYGTPTTGWTSSPSGSSNGSWARSGSTPLTGMRCTPSRC